jgi:hypothetical protein
MTLQHHQPDGHGGLQPKRTTPADWRTQLRSPRGGASLEDGRLPALDNVEMNPTGRMRSVLFWVALAAATFLIIVVGYGTGFWSLPG